MQAEKTEVIRTGITGSTLKIIAMITMLIDHIGATIVLQLVQRNSDNFDAFGNVRMTGMVILYYVLRGIGRLAFPIFIFLLLEGFQHTHNRFLYIGRLLLFAIISEIPFDLAVNLSTNSILKGHVLEFASQNVFFTLAIGMIVLTALEGLRTLQMDTILKTILIVGVVAFGAALAYALHTDYGAVGRPGDLYGIWIPESKKGTADGSSLCCIISIKYVRIMRTCGCRHCPFLQWKTRVEIKMGILHILSAAFADSCRHLRAAF